MIKPVPRIWPASFAVLTLLLGTPVSAQDKLAEIDKIFSWATPTAPGCAVAVAQHGKVVVNRAYGSGDLERNVPLSPDSVFDAGSLVKQFVAASTLLLVEEGRLSLSEDVHKYIPELPDYGQKITLDHLLTHTSGIRDWTGMLPLTGGNVDALTLTLRQRGLNFAPGEEWAYSNGGYVLLKEIVARTSGMSFAEFTRKRLFEPLGMKSTAYTNDLRAVVRNRALAYDKQFGQWRMAMLLDNDRGGGGALLSTTGDLLLWNEALTSGRFGKFVSEKIQEPAMLSNGRKLGYARGLFLDTNRGGRVVWHSGSADGYKSMLSRFPEQALSIAIMCNSGDDTNRAAFARRLYDLFVPGTREAAAEENAPAAVDVDLKSRQGLFFNERTGEPLRLVVDGSRFRIAGGPALVPVDADRFKRAGAALSFMSQDEFELRFLSPDQFELKSMEGKTTRYRRAQPYAPTAADLQAFAGRFESGEIGTVFQLVPGEDMLTIRLENAPDKTLEFRPVDRDTFQRGGMTVRFLRDKDGKVVAFDYSNPVIRNVKFMRLNDRAN
ncbi:MAG TPA: serine hydrolase domain-containing protein [Thermoanaerobaculia bacterium]